VPQIVRWPAAVARRQASDVPIVTHDWTATFADIAGVEPDPAYPFDGVSLARWLLDGAPAPERDLFWRMRGRGALRRGDWKYVNNTATANATHELFHLASDPSERANLAAREPAQLAELRGAWDAIAGTLLPYP
jgi:arylsulfatase A-like enzyme